MLGSCQSAARRLSYGTALALVKLVPAAMATEGLLISNVPLPVFRKRLATSTLTPLSVTVVPLSNSVSNAVKSVPVAKLRSSPSGVTLSDCAARVGLVGVASVHSSPSAPPVWNGSKSLSPPFSHTARTSRAAASTERMRKA